MIKAIKNLLSMDTENQQLRKRIQQLEEECTHLRDAHHEEVMDGVDIRRQLKEFMATNKQFNAQVNTLLNEQIKARSILREIGRLVEIVLSEIPDREDE